MTEALAQHALGETEKAVITLERASRQLVSSQGYHKGTGYSPYAAEVLLREAEAKIGGQTGPDAK